MAARDLTPSFINELIDLVSTDAGALADLREPYHWLDGIGDPEVRRAVRDSELDPRLVRRLQTLRATVDEVLEKVQEA